MTTTDAPHTPGVVLVAFEPGASNTVRSNARSGVGTVRPQRVSRSLPDLEIVGLRPGLTVDDALRRLRGQPGVRYAEPDYLIEPAYVANDPLYSAGDQWGVGARSSTPPSEYGTGASVAWAAGYVGSRDVYVGIVDEGVQYDHPDLAANVWTNPFDPVDGVDNDGNGYVDDVQGWDFFNNDNSVFDGTAARGKDDHGTHVAGIIGAEGGNGIGVAGVNWAVTMISAKFLGPNGGSSAGAIRALDYLTDLKRRHGLAIVATNNSWGYRNGYGRALREAIARTGDAGMLFVAAAGNDGTNNDLKPFNPASFECTIRQDTGAPRGHDCILSVASIAQSGALSTFSNRGARTVDLGAPGQRVMSTFARDHYGLLSGTSMAAPHVTGAIALCASMNPDLDAADLRAAILDSTTATESLTGKTVTGGRLDIGAMLSSCAPQVTPATAPTAPVDVEAEPFDASALVTWARPISDGGSTINTYQVSSTPGDFTCSTNGALNCMVGGLANDTGYTFTVQAWNAIGAGPPSDPSQPVVPGPRDETALSVDPPSVALVPQPALAISIQVRLGWADGLNSSAIDSYQLQRRSGSGAWKNVTLPDPGATDVVLAVDRTVVHTFRLRAMDASGAPGAWATTGPHTFSVVQETSNAVSYTGTFARKYLSGASGGYVRKATEPGWTATLAFEGTGVAFVTTIAPNRGIAEVWLDGLSVGWIDLYASARRTKHLAWAADVAPGAHVLTVRITGTKRIGSTSLRVDVDAFLILR